MKRISQIVRTLMFFAAAVSGYAVSGQTSATPDNQYAALVSWTQYQISSQKVSISLPKLPVLRKRSNPRSEIDSEQYHAYANGVVYEFEWHAKSRSSIPDWCSQKTKFSIAAFTSRIEDLKKLDVTYKESDTLVAGIDAKALRADSGNGSVIKTRWLVWEKDRWFEFGITRRRQTVVDEMRFLSGFKLSSSSGVDVGSGADRTLGDLDVEQQTAVEGKTNERLVIVSKPRAAYTDVARQSHIQGTVILRVVFLGNGGTGTILVVKKLPYGLTEEAIKAARKVSFLPQTDGGVPVNVVKEFEYTFGIY